MLPLYIVIMGGFPPLLILMRRSPDLALGASACLYVLARLLDWNFRAYPSGGWYFNPFAWQLLFTMGAWAALGGRARVQGLARSNIVLGASIAFAVFALAVTLSIRLDSADILPAAVRNLFDPNDKTNLAPYRILHLLALAVIVVRLLPKDWRGLHSLALRPAIVCGQRSLEVFCVGIFLSFVGHFILEMYSNAMATQIAVSAIGILLMTVVAFYRTWSRTLDAPSAAGTSTAAGRRARQGEAA